MRDSLRRSKVIFTENVDPPSTSRILPEVNQPLISTSQLVYCLKILSQSEDMLPEEAQEWRKKTLDNVQETERLNNLARNVVRAFERDELKDANAVAEVISLGPFLSGSDVRFLLTHFIHELENSDLFNVDSLDWIARMMKSMAPSSPHEIDLAITLSSINKRTHLVKADQIYQMVITIACILDTMVDNRGELNKKDLDEPLAVYLSELKGHVDPYIAFQAEYAFQALQVVPDNESSWQPVQAVQAVQGLLAVLQVMKQGEKAEQVVQAVLSISFRKASQGDRIKRAWYLALRGFGSLLEEG